MRRAWMLTAMLCAAAPAGAQTAERGLEAGAPAIAEQRYQLGREHYLLGDIESAVREFQGAYDIYPESSKLAFNLARCYERLDRYDEALRYYQRYLELAPEADDHDDVSRLVAGLKRRLGIEDPPPPVEAPPVEPPPPVEEPPPVEQPPVEQPPVEAPPVEAPPPSQPTIAERLDRPWGIHLEGGFLVTNAYTFDEPRVVGGLTRTVTVTGTDDLVDAFGLAASWDHPIGLGGLRIGARLGFHTSVVDDDLGVLDHNVTTLDAWVRYVQPARKVGLYVAGGGGVGSLVVSGDAEAEAFGGHAIVAGGILIPAGRVLIDIGLGWDVLILAEYEYSPGNLALRDNQIARPHARAGVQF